jgi:hypothetical protein
MALAGITALAVALVTTPLGTGATSTPLAAKAGKAAKAVKAQGARGPRGPRGKRGLRGPRGYRGFLGAPGPAGVQGPPGLLSSADDLQGLPCTQKDKPGVVITARLLDPNMSGTTSLDAQCVYADGYEPNNTRAQESELSALADVPMSVYPADDEDWLASDADPGATAQSLYVSVSGGAGPTMDVYRDTVLVASGVTCAADVIAPGAHSYEVRVVGAGAAAYSLGTGSA